MPRRKKADPIRRTYSRDLKRRVIYQAFTLSHSSTAVSISLDMPLRVVQRIRWNWRTIGEVCMDRTYMGRPPSMGRPAVKVRFPFLLPIGCLNAFPVHVSIDFAQP
jgi:hypothetical protein